MVSTRPVKPESVETKNSDITTLTTVRPPANNEHEYRILRHSYHEYQRALLFPIFIKTENFAFLRIFFHSACF